MPRTRKAKKLAHRSAPARALEKPEHRSRVIPNKKRSPSRNSKRARISKSLAEVLADTAVVIPAGSGESRIDIERPKLTRLIERSNRVGFDRAVAEIIADHGHHRASDDGMPEPEPRDQPGVEGADWSLIPADPSDPFDGGSISYRAPRRKRFAFLDNEGWAWAAGMSFIAFVGVLIFWLSHYYPA